MVTLNKTLSLGLVLACLASLLFFGPQVFAGSGDGGGSGGSSGCDNSWWNTCYGASWRYYTTNSDTVTIPNGNSSKCNNTIPGYGSNCTAPGRYIKGCASAGGYWRYAFEQPSNNGSFTKGQQVGVGEIGGVTNIENGGSNAYRSEFFGGGMNFIATSAKTEADYNAGNLQNGDRGTWSLVQSIYSSLTDSQKRDPDTGVVHGWNANSKLGWFCAGRTPKNDPAIFYSKSSVSAAGSDQTSAANSTTTLTKTISSPSTTVTFWHNVARSDSVSSSATASWTVSGSNNTPSSTSGSFASTSSSRSQEVSRTSNITVSLEPGERIQLCQTVKYSPKNTDESGSSGTSKACVIIIRQVVNISCPIDGSTNSTADKGYTFAQSGVRNLSATDAAWKKTTNSSHTVAAWAKPGDTVQFTHSLCFGAQAVTGGPGDNRNLKPTTANTATIKAFTTPATSGANYLFGNTLTGTNSRTINLGTGTKRPGSVSNADTVGDYYFTYNSPSSGSGSTYKCYSGAAGFPTFKNNGYQIPGFTTSTKPSDCKAVAASDVGKTIEQDLEWNNLTTTASRTGSDEPYYFNIAASNATGATKKAQVKIPYNYTTSTNTSIPGGGDPVVSGGTDGKITVDIKVNPRGDNPNITDEYATISKPTTYEVVSFLVTPTTTTTPTRVKGSGNVTGSSSDRACTYYTYGSGGSVYDCTSLKRETKTFNESGKLTNVPAENVLNLSVNLEDLPVGTKYCVATAIFPSNSHNTNGKPANNDAALTSTGTTWNYTQAKCVTIAKKPTVQFWGQSVFTNGGVKTSTTKKTPGTTSTTTSTTSTANSTASRRVFGSWSEYDLIARGGVADFASGAGYGYTPNNGGALSAARPGGYPLGSASASPDVCTYSSQTFNNDKCDSKVTGSANINADNLATTLSRLIARYTSSTAAKASGTTANLTGSCVAQSNGKYTASGGNYTCLDNGAKYFKVNGNTTITSAVTLAKNQTVVIEATGTVTINANIFYGSAATAYQSIDELPQMLIFAKDINIHGTVENIDAWLVARGDTSKGVANGTIDTCHNMPSTSSSAVTSSDYISACGKALEVNGPVFAGKLALKRNAGAGQGNDSINSAEIFNLRADTYLWSYAQSQRFSQSVTTYTRELAPRF